MANETIDGLRDDALGALRTAADQRSLDTWRVEYLGRKGRLTGVLRGLDYLAVGDTHDAVLLRRLAAATGGLATTMNPGDDLGWRAFDLVATLNTPRILDLTAELETASGAVVPVAAYADSAQLADGEELSVVAKVDDAPMKPRANRARNISESVRAAAIPKKPRPWSTSTRT